MSWNFKDISSNYCPRQFEYHPAKNGLIFGTVCGEVCAVDTERAASLDNATSTDHIKSLGYFGKNKNDTMLGLCWMRPQPYYDTSVTSGGFFSCGNNNSNLFVSGSSSGRVVLGDASRAFDPENPDKYSILHDYPIFDRLTSVHVNSTNKLLLLSGYSTGVNIVDLETGTSVRTYHDIHTDHVNISRFSYLSPHLFATSSFDSTIKTWDLRQATTTSGTRDGSVVTSAKPIYTVKCGSGVVMINFSKDDNFILASALDNEINQYFFLDGRKHLTYNLPKTGLKGNFTRAYYSASGRHTLTGACEESSVKVMCAYTGETLSQIELYPGKKDKSLYIQSLRGCPIDEEQMCVLTNYRDLQTRELVMVTRDPSAPSARSLAADATLPATTGISDVPAVTVPSVSKNTPARSVCDWFASPAAPATNESATAEHSIWNFFMGDDPKENSKAGDKTGADDTKMDVEGEETAINDGDSPEEEFALLTNNAFMHNYSSQYVEVMRSLHRFCTSMIHSYSTNKAPDGKLQLSLSTRLSLAPDDGGASNARDLADVIILVHARNTVMNMSDEALKDEWFLLPVHAYILQARCPALHDIFLRQQSFHFHTTALLKNAEDDASDSLAIPIVDISANVLSASAPTTSGSVRTSNASVPENLLFLLPLVVDYLYTGNRAIDLTVLRFYTLQQLVQEEIATSRGAPSFAPFIPMVDEILRAEIKDHLARKVSKANSASAYFSEEDARQEAYHATRKYFVLHEKDEVELLVKMCVDEHCWRQSDALSVALVHMLQQLLELAALLSLRALRDLACSLLEQSLCLTNAVAVYELSMKFECAALHAACLQYIAAHKDILRDEIGASQSDLHAESVNLLGKRQNSSETAAKSAPQAVALAAKVEALSAERSVEVVHRSEFRARRDTLMEKARRAQPSGKSKNAVDNTRWLSEEAPFIAGDDAIPPSICLPRYISPAATPMFDHSVIFLGGQNLDRLHSLTNRVLTYNYTTNEYKFVTCGGTYMPKCGYMICAGALQKRNPTHMLAFGGKLKKMEISVTQTTLPQHLQTLSPSLGVALAPDSDEKKSGPDKRLTGIHVATSGPTSLVHNRLIDIWNLRADREELSAPTAAAAAASVEAALQQLLNPQEAGEEEQASVALTRNIAKSTGVIFELDYRTLAWRSPCVHHITTTTLSSYAAHNLTRTLQHQDEVQRLTNALTDRVGQTVSCLHHEDVAYRCAQCLFSTHPAVMCNCQNTNGVYGNGKTWMIQFGGYCNQTEAILNDLHILTAEPKGIAGQDETHVEYEYSWMRTTATGEAPPGRFSHATAVIPFRPHSSASPGSDDFLLHAYTRMLVLGGVSHDDTSVVSSLRINYSSASLPNRSAHCNEFSSYAHWEEVEAIGPSPAARQGHSLVHLPDTNLCVLFGGSQTTNIGQANNHCLSDVWVMRVLGVELIDPLSGETGMNISWSNLTLAGVPPSLRSRHTAFAVPAHSSHTYSSSLTSLEGVLFVFGGIDEHRMHQRQNRSEEAKSADFDDEQKDSIMHTMHVTASMVGVRSTSRNGTWLSQVSPFARSTARSTCLLSRFLYFVSEISVPMPACTLSKDMMSLLDPIFHEAFSSGAKCLADVDMKETEGNHDEEGGESDTEDETTAQLERMRRIARDFFTHRGLSPRAKALQPDLVGKEPGLKVNVIDPTGHTTHLALFHSLLCRRCEWFDILLSSAMQGERALQQATELFDTDPAAFVLLLVFIYSDALMICSMQDVVAVLELANQYNLTFLAKKCEGVLVRLVTLHNLCELLDYSDTVNLETLRTACTAVFLRDVIGVHPDDATLMDFFPDMHHSVNASPAKPSASQNAIFSADSHLAVEVSRDAALKADLVAAFAQLSPDLRADLWRRVCQDVNVFTSDAEKVSRKVIDSDVAVSAAAPVGKSC